MKWIFFNGEKEHKITWIVEDILKKNYSTNLIYSK